MKKDSLKRFWPLLILLAALVMAAVPAFQDFCVTQFGTSGNKVLFKDGALSTNFNNDGILQNRAGGTTNFLATSNYVQVFPHTANNAGVFSVGRTSIVRHLTYDTSSGVLALARNSSGNTVIAIDGGTTGTIGVGTNAANSSFSIFNVGSTYTTGRGLFGSGNTIIGANGITNLGSIFTLSATTLEHAGGVTNQAAEDTTGLTTLYGGVKIPTGAASGNLLTSDSSGVGTWVAPPTNGFASITYVDTSVNGASNVLQLTKQPATANGTNWGNVATGSVMIAQGGQGNAQFSTNLTVPGTLSASNVTVSGTFYASNGVSSVGTAAGALSLYATDQVHYASITASKDIQTNFVKRLETNALGGATWGIPWTTNVFTDATGSTGQVQNVSAGSESQVVTVVNGKPAFSYVYASNIVSGGQFPLGTVATNTPSAGQILYSDGTIRYWSNAPTSTTSGGSASNVWLNTGPTNQPGQLILSFGSGLTVSTNNNTNVVVSETTANPIISSNAYTINAYYTNTDGTTIYIKENFTVTSTITELAKVSLFLDQDGDGTWEDTAHSIQNGAGVAMADIQWLAAFVTNGGRFMFTNQSVGSATATVLAGSGKKVSGFGAGPQGATGATGATGASVSNYVTAAFGSIDVTNTVTAYMWIGRGGVPTVATNTGGASSVAFLGTPTDSRMQVTNILNSGSYAAANPLFTVTFSQALSNVPYVFMTPANRNAAHAVYFFSPYVTATTTNFDVRFDASYSQSGGVIWNVWVVQ